MKAQLCVEDIVHKDIVRKENKIEEVAVMMVNYFVAFVYEV